MSDYMIILGWGAACIVAGLVAMAREKVKFEGQGQQWNRHLSDCVEVRK